MASYTLPDLPYDYAALEPHISGEIIELHHDKHHAAYVKGANDTLEKLADARDKGDFGAIVGLEKTLAFHLSGHTLHTLYWQNLSGDGGDKPDGALAAAIDADFGSFDGFKAQLTQATATTQGSGWGVLSYDSLGKQAHGPAGLRPPGQRRHRQHPAAGLRRLGARVLPAVQEREAGLRRRALEHRQLGRCRRSLRRRQQGRPHRLTARDAPRSRGARACRGLRRCRAVAHVDRDQPGAWCRRRPGRCRAPGSRTGSAAHGDATSGSPPVAGSSR